MRLDEWLKLRTFSHRQFIDARQLLHKKNTQKLTVSLCLPALNEAKTIGEAIKTLKKNLCDKIPLLDEIFVIDSGSTDGTQEIARRAGVMVFDSAEILPEMGNHRGKGENLWKSLHIANGDIILWLDSDISNMHPRFVLGLLGPLLDDPQIGFIKGYYRRPLKIGKKMQSTGGGRVTELLVKPFLNQLFPQLAVFNQPLSGEYGGRRELLERMPFFSGYGVETGLLIDVEHRYGLPCMAQVDLDVRIHRNQSTESLRKMAFGILRVLLTRAEQQGKLVTLDNLNSQFLTVLRDGEDQFDIKAEEYAEVERPPIVRCKSYQKKRHFREDDLVLLQETQERMNYPIVSVSNLLDPRLIVLDGDAADKETALQAIGKLFVRHGIARSFPQIMRDLYARENVLSTGIGSGIAIPHDLSANINHMKIAVYRPAQSIPFDSLDGQPVNLIMAVVGPHGRRQLYLQVLANLSTILRDVQVRNHLLTVRTKRDFISKLKKIEVVKRIERELRLVES